MFPISHFSRRGPSHGDFHLHAFHIIVLSVFLLNAAPSQADEAADRAKEQELIAVLKSDAAPDRKAITCKQLAQYGSSEAVSALAPLLSDERLASWARIALEAIPGPEAGAVLREAATTLKGRLQLGAVNSIGVRRDADSVDTLSQLLKSDDGAVASAAALALGRVGNAPATKQLREALAGAPAAVRAAVAEGCILCAERLMAAGDADTAAAIYDEVRQADVPKTRRREATRGAILARKSNGIPLLIETLTSADRGLLQIGLGTARELPGADVTEALVKQLENLPSERGALVLHALADRGDKSAVPAVLDLVRAGKPELQIAAVAVLRQLGDASSVPALLEAAVAVDRPEATEAAREALATLPGAEVDTAITSRLAAARGNLLIVLLDLVGRRRLDALADVRKALDHDDPRVRHAALTALGETIPADDLSLLIGRVTAPKQPEDRPVAQQALRAASVRMPDREACAKQLVAALANRPVPVQIGLLEILADVGGEQALRALGDAAKGTDSQLQDTATRLLGAWFNVDAAPVLMELAKMPDHPYNIRALRGYLRLARQFTMPDTQRADMCREALRATNRPAEQKLVLEVIERYPSSEMLAAAMVAAATPALKDDATRIALAMVPKVGGQPADAAQLRAWLGRAPLKLEIVKAEYGAGDMQRDVTETVRRHARNVPLIGLPSSNYNTAFGGDPAPGSPKQLRIQYRVDGNAGEATFAENAIVLLPAK